MAAGCGATALYSRRGVASLLPCEPEVAGLLALLLPTPAGPRTDDLGDLVLPEDQDPQRRDRNMIADGEAILEAGLRRGLPGRYQLHPAIGACHSTAASAEATDWQQIALLYGERIRDEPTLMVEANRGRRGDGRETGRGAGHPRRPGSSPATAAVGPAVHRPGRAAQAPRARRRGHRRVSFGARTGTGRGVPVLHRQTSAGTKVGGQRGPGPSPLPSS